jgi:hypothetical protein
VHVANFNSPALHSAWQWMPCLDPSGWRSHFRPSRGSTRHWCLMTPGDSATFWVGLILLTKSFDFLHPIERGILKASENLEAIFSFSISLMVLLFFTHFVFIIFI